jgi:hypothetical protein
MAVREMVQQVSEGEDAKLLLEQVGFLWSDALQVFDGGS